MSEWRSGEFERGRITTVLRAFAPARAADCLEDIGLDELKSEGKRLILLDVDNTLVEWKQENFSEGVLEWIEQAKRLDFKICIISNTRHVQRLERIRETLGVETVRGRFKPSRAMYRLALIKFGCKREEAIMIGDQMMTDVFGANRAGIDAVWVRQMASKEFGPTKINRAIEGLLSSAVYKALILPEDHGADTLSPATQQEVRLVEQIVRFLIVGGTSFVIDAGLTFLLMRWQGDAFGGWLKGALPWLFSIARTPDEAAAPIFAGMASLVAMFNSYFWNRIWTFEARGKSRKSTQIARFYMISIAGAGLNTLLFSAFYKFVFGHHVLFCKAVAAGIVAVWNFVGQRQFAFKESKA